MRGYQNPRTLWQLTHPGSRLARAIMYSQWDCFTLTFWLGNTIQTTAKYSDETDARTAARTMERELLANGWHPLHEA